MAHTVKESELDDYVQEQRSKWMLFARAGDKRFEFRMNGDTPIFCVSYQGKDTYVGILKETAVREYNSLPS